MNTQKQNTTPLHKQLTNYIKTHGRIHHRDVEKYCEDNKYKVYTGVRRLQEVRQPNHRNYDPEIGALDKNGDLITDTSTTIHWFVYLPAFTQTQNLPRREEKRPGTPNSTTQRQDWRKSSDFHRPTQTCCKMAIYCWENNIPITHSSNCETK